ncbi:MAG: hypothetical protein IJU40_01490 [Desulfovibrionaceae bacterium]|nr:hypothetical protein [Desulfovibrionaceae bacterium]
MLLTPPKILLNDCPKPTSQKIADSSNLKELSIAVTELNFEYEKALSLCNADKAALRRWYEQAAKEVEQK